MRSVLLLLAALTAGCVTGPRLYDWPSRDLDRDKVREAIHPVAVPSFERHVRGADWAPKPLAPFSSYNCGGEACWGVAFVCRPGGREDEVGDLSPDERRRVLGAVRADILAAVEKTGVNVTWAPAVEVADGPKPEVRFAIRYLRKVRDTDWEVSGEIVGKLPPVESAKDPFTEVRVTLNEWPCK